MTDCQWNNRVMMWWHRVCPWCIWQQNWLWTKKGHENLQSVRCARRRGRRANSHRNRILCCNFKVYTIHTRRLYYVSVIKVVQIPPQCVNCDVIIICPMGLRHTAMYAVLPNLMQLKDTSSLVVVSRRMIVEANAILLHCYPILSELIGVCKRGADYCVERKMADPLIKDRADED